MLARVDDASGQQSLVHSNLHQIFLHVTYGRESVLFWRRCDTLSTFGCVDDVAFERNGQE